MKPYGFHEGNRSETYAEAALLKIGYVVRVPCPVNYFGVDFIVKLFEPTKCELRLNGAGVACR